MRAFAVDRSEPSAGVPGAHQGHGGLGAVQVGGAHVVQGQGALLRPQAGQGLADAATANQVQGLRREIHAVIVPPQVGWWVQRTAAAIDGAAWVRCW